ncbi:MAG: phage holin family protein [Bacteroidetes bacterium]|nr:phage holin family protein [Bacteroidota bacterium]
MNFIVKIILSAIAVLITAWLLPGVSVEGNSFFTALMIAVALAFLNAVLKPILVFLTIPITILTLGFFYLVINAGIILLAEHLVNGFHVSGFFTALLFSFVLSITASILDALAGIKNE